MANDASGTKGEKSALDGRQAAKNVSFLASVVKAAGTAHALDGGDSATEVINHFKTCNANVNGVEGALDKLAGSLSATTKAPTLKDALVTAIKEVKPVSSAEASVKLLVSKTDFSHDGEQLKPLKLPSLADPEPGHEAQGAGAGLIPPRPRWRARRSLSASRSCLSLGLTLTASARTS